jgi:hypothetical protein
VSTVVDGAVAIVKVDVTAAGALIFIVKDILITRIRGHRCRHSDRLRGMSRDFSLEFLVGVGRPVVGRGSRRRDGRGKVQGRGEYGGGFGGLG